jgi:hypothetical protein
MFVPEGYTSLRDAIEWVARMREPDAVAALTPDGFAFFARAEAVLRSRPLPAQPLAPVRPIRAGPSPGPARDLRPPEPTPDNSALAAALCGSPEAADQARRWGEARQKLEDARGKARADLRQALISGTVRAAAVRDDGDLVTMDAAEWRRYFERRRWIAYGPIGGDGKQEPLEPFAEAIEGRTVAVGATRNQCATALGHPIIARADLARWCSAPAEPEPADRPRDWPAAASANSESRIAIAGPRIKSEVPDPRRTPWLSVDDALCWIAFRGRAQLADEAARAHALHAAERALVAAAAAGRIGAKGEAGTREKPTPGVLPGTIPPDAFGKQDAGLSPLNGGKLGLRSFAPISAVIEYAGPFFHHVRFDAAAILAEWPPEPASPAPPVPPLGGWTLAEAAAALLPDIYAAASQPTPENWWAAGGAEPHKQKRDALRLALSRMLEAGQYQATGMRFLQGELGIIPPHLWRAAEFRLGLPDEPTRLTELTTGSIMWDGVRVAARQPPTPMEASASGIGSPARGLAPANRAPIASPWDAAPPGWVTLDALPQAVARLTQAPADAAASVLRPLLETGALPWRWRQGAEPRGLIVSGSGILYGPVDSEGRPPGLDWPALFSPAGAEARSSIEVDVPAAIAAMRRAFPAAEPTAETTAETVGTDAGPLPEILSTGAPGRPTSMHLIRPEHQRRLDAGEAHDAVASEARHLAAWFGEKHSKAPQPTAKAIENAIRDAHRQRATRPPK